MAAQLQIDPHSRAQSNRASAAISGVHPTRTQSFPQAALTQHVDLARSLNTLSAATRALRDDRRCADVRNYLLRFIDAAVDTAETLVELATSSPHALPIVESAYAFVGHLVDELTQLAVEQHDEPGGWGATARSFPEFVRVYYSGFLAPRLAGAESCDLSDTQVEDLRMRLVELAEAAQDRPTYA